MKLLSFRIGTRATFGALVYGRVYDLGEALAGKYADLRAVLAADALGELPGAIGNAKSYAPDKIEYLPVIPNPAKIFCVGLNYKAHAAEAGHEPLEVPVIFSRFAASQAGHDQPMLLPPESSDLDFEGEIAVILGKGGRRIKEADAAAHIAGYAPYNDGSIRDWQLRSLQWIPGKNFATTGAFGPWMATADELDENPDLTLITRLNGQEVQRTSSHDMIFSVPYLIAFCSTFVELEAGDVIVTGTPGGVGMMRDPKLWMKDGDVCEIEVQPIGVLRSPIKAEVV